jgi:hypothetical protein
MFKSMNSLIQSAFHAIGKRQRSLIPTWHLGTGAQFGKLLPYARQLSFTLLVVVFFQELNDDERRTREDLIRAVEDICRYKGLGCSYDEAEKIVDSLLWSEGKHYNFAFEDTYFDETDHQWKSYRFQFLVLDKEISDLDNGLQVYKLSEASQEIVLKTHEILEELDISMQQLIADMLIKNGRLTKALHMLDALDFKVRNLINEEKAHREDLVRNPKRALFENKTRWGRQLDKIKEQFAEERSRYDQMNRTLRTLEVSEHERSIYLQLTDRIIKTSNYHDELAQLVIQNIRLEMQILTNHFDGMWLPKGTSFKKDVWETNILTSGFASPDDMLALVETVFVPKKPFLLPLEWGIEEHSVFNRETTFVDGEETPEEDELDPIDLDWDTIISLWEHAFTTLLGTGELSIAWIKDLDEVTLSRWIAHKEAFDFWLSFGTLETPIFITEDLLDESTDNPSILLIQKLIEKDEKFEALIGKSLSPRLDDETTAVSTIKKVSVSNFTLKLKDVDKL